MCSDTYSSAVKGLDVEEKPPISLYLKTDRPVCSRSLFCLAFSEDKNDLRDNKIKSNPMNNAVFLSCSQEMFVSRYCHCLGTQSLRLTKIRRAHKDARLHVVGA